ncbi:hypothetical protein ACFPH8_12120 [Bizionia hallyeonensis]|uniref:Uncharacterized protein n=1 Tax=Bizionia hallyeonensis TaxID=1123757 RepID=A0ABW0CA08_9FLAO
MKQFKTLFCLIFLTALFNCEQDDFIETDNQNATQSQFKVTNVNKEFVFSNTSISNKLNAINSNTNEPINLEYSREVHNEEHGFTVETENVKFVENTVTGFHSYNFDLKRDNPENDKIENLVFHLNASGTYDAFIVKYGFTKAEYETLDLALLNSLSTKYTAISFDELDFVIESNKMMYFICTETWLWLDSVDHSGQLHGAPRNGVCKVSGCNYRESGYVLQSSSCVATTGTGNPNNNGPTNTPNEGPNGYGTGSNPFVSAPNYTQPWENVQKCMNGFNQPNTMDNTVMDLIMIDWLKANKHKAGKIQNFLGESGCSEEAQEIMLDVTSIMIANPNMDFEEALEQYFMNNPDIFIEQLTISQDSPHPINNLNDYLNCFDDGKPVQNYGYVLYVDQPVDGTRNVFNYYNQTPGHTFFTLFKNNMDGTSVNLTIGFYPEGNDYKDLGNWDGPGIFQDNGYPGDEHEYDIYITFDDISITQFNGIINDIQLIANSDYDLDDNNCTNVAHNLAVNNLGFNMTPSTSDIPILPGAGSCINPGDYGEDLREMMHNSNNPYSSNIGIPIDNYNDAITSSGACN